VTGLVKALAERRSIEPALPYKFLFSRSLNVAARRSTFLQDVAAGRRTVIDDLNGATVGMGEPAVRKRRSTKRLRR
jgi:ketopantoate reductase